MIKVVGIGNRLMMDDGIAIAVLKNIGNKLESMGMEVIIGETDFQYCFHRLRDNDFVIILDSTYSGAGAGTIHLYKLEETVPVCGKINLHHDISIFDLIHFYSKPIRGYLIGIEIAEIGFGYELSESVKLNFDAICFAVEKSIYEILKEVQKA